MSVADLDPLEVGIFAKTFARPTLDGVLGAAKGYGFRALHFNFACAGLPALPADIDEATCQMIRNEFKLRQLVMVGVSATYNTIHPDTRKRKAQTRQARRVIEAAPFLGTNLVTLCTGTRDPDDMWRAHPANGSRDAWDDLLGTMESLVEAAESADVWLGVEPEAANVVSSASKARRLIDNVGSDRIRIVLDPANLVTAESLSEQRAVLAEAFELLHPFMIQAHAKDIDREGRHVAAGLGELDYGVYMQLLVDYGAHVPIIMHELGERDVERATRFVLSHRNEASPSQ